MFQSCQYGWHCRTTGIFHSFLSLALRIQHNPNTNVSRHLAGDRLHNYDKSEKKKWLTQINMLVIYFASTEFHLSNFVWNKSLPYLILTFENPRSQPTWHCALQGVSKQFFYYIVSKQFVIYLFIYHLSGVPMLPLWLKLSIHSYLPIFPVLGCSHPAWAERCVSASHHLVGGPTTDLLLGHLMYK